MNEQTKIELLKISIELITFNANKFPLILIDPDTGKIFNKPAITLFNDCVKAVHEQYQQLVEDVGIESPGKCLFIYSLPNSLCCASSTASLTSAPSKAPDLANATMPSANSFVGSLLCVFLLIPTSSV